MSDIITLWLQYTSVKHVHTAVNFTEAEVIVILMINSLHYCCYAGASDACLLSHHWFGFILSAIIHNKTLTKQADLQTSVMNYLISCELCSGEWNVQSVGKYMGIHVQNHLYWRTQSKVKLLYVSCQTTWKIFRCLCSELDWKGIGISTMSHWGKRCIFFNAKPACKGKFIYSSYPANQSTL